MYQELKLPKPIWKQKIILETARKCIYIYFCFGINIFCVFGLDQIIFDLSGYNIFLIGHNQGASLICQGHWTSLGSCGISCWYQFCSCSCSWFPSTTFRHFHHLGDNSFVQTKHMVIEPLFRYLILFTQVTFLILGCMNVFNVLDKWHLNHNSIVHTSPIVDEFLVSCKLLSTQITSLEFRRHRIHIIL